MSTAISSIRWMSNDLTQQRIRQVEKALLARWPETKLDPSLDRIAALCDLLGEPQRSYPSVHLTGTNGKTSTARMMDTLVRALGLRTGRFTSPHLRSVTERIAIDGAPITDERFVEVYDEVEPYAMIIDRSSEIPLSFFEMLVGMAYAAFADAPVDAALVEVGMGGFWDATNVIDARVAVVTPIDVDHVQYLGDSPDQIAIEKAGIIKPDSIAVLGQQTLEVAEVLMRRSVDVGATVAREGIEFGVTARTPAVGGQQVSVQGLAGAYPDLFLPLYGAHQASNLATAIAAVEAFAGTESSDGLDLETLQEAVAHIDSPGRLEVVRRSPVIILDSAHNPHGARATADALQESFTLAPLIGVLGISADKDIDGILEAFEPVFSTLVCTQHSMPRSLRAEALGHAAEGIFGADRVVVESRLDDAIERAVTLAEAEDVGSGDGAVFGGGGVLIGGSIFIVGEARTLLRIDR
jgi:dihydrofolate synthase / folylpolyglutamate synthase